MEGTLTPFDLRGATLRIPPLAGISWKVRQVVSKGQNVGKDQRKVRNDALVWMVTPGGAKSSMQWEELELMLVKGEVTVELTGAAGGTTAQVKGAIARELREAEGVQ